MELRYQLDSDDLMLMVLHQRWVEATDRTVTPGLLSIREKAYAVLSDAMEAAMDKWQAELSEAGIRGPSDLERAIRRKMGVAA